ncbi:conserved hypothetical protein [Arthrobacter sp. Hiyo8]|nr:conserved hypothetical protein [Arthrobacter sp. Hiyo8]
MAAPVEDNSAPASQESRKPSAHDLEILSRQLGRPVRDVVEIPARCVCGNPLVAATAPRLSNGTPFPTTFYLTHPVITAAVSRLEAGGLMNEMNERLTADEPLAAAYRSAHEAYLQARDEIAGRAGTGDVPEIAGVSAGGMPTRVKCLHVLVGHSLAAGPGVNPLGDEAIGRLANGGPRTAAIATAHGTVRGRPVQGPQPPRTAGPAGHRGPSRPVRKSKSSHATEPSGEPSAGGSTYEPRSCD